MLSDCFFLYYVTDLLSDTMMFLCWLTGLLSETMSLCWLTDLLLETMMFLCCLTLKWQTCCQRPCFMLTGRPAVTPCQYADWQTCCQTMFLCWLSDRPAVRHWCHFTDWQICQRPWCFYADCLTDLLWDIDVFVPTVWQTCCQRLWCQPLSSCWSPWARCARCLTT